MTPYMLEWEETEKVRKHKDWCIANHLVHALCEDKCCDCDGSVKP